MPTSTWGSEKRIIMTTEENIKFQRNRLETYRYISARSLSEKYPDVESVDIDVVIDFLSAITHPIKEFHQEIHKGQKVYVYFPCINPDCTGSGFNLTRFVENSIESRKPLDGVLHCDGKEDWKYIGHTGCSCQTTLSYHIFPHFSPTPGTSEP